MGKRGPPRKPVKLLKASGSWRAKKRASEPVPPRGRPNCPRWLRPRAKELWRTVAPKLEAMGVLSQLDARALARYCDLWALWREANERILTDGTASIVNTKQGPVEKVSPDSMMLLKIGEQLVRLEAQFGLTPAARAALAGPGEKKPHGRQSQGKERFFNKRKA